MDRDRLLLYFAIGIGIVWAVMVFSTIWTHDLAIVTVITPVMGTVATILIALLKR